MFVSELHYGIALYFFYKSQVESFVKFEYSFAALKTELSINSACSKHNNINSKVGRLLELHREFCLYRNKISLTITLNI